MRLGGQSSRPNPSRQNPYVKAIGVKKQTPSNQDLSRLWAQGPGICCQGRLVVLCILRKKCMDIVDTLIGMVPCRDHPQQWLRSTVANAQCLDARAERGVHDGGRQRPHRANFGGCQLTVFHSPKELVFRAQLCTFAPHSSLAGQREYHSAAPPAATHNTQVTHERRHPTA